MVLSQARRPRMLENLLPETCIHTQLEYSLGIPANTKYKQSP